MQLAEPLARVWNSHPQDLGSFSVIVQMSDMGVGNCPPYVAEASERRLCAAHIACHPTLFSRAAFTAWTSTAGEKATLGCTGDNAGVDPTGYPCLLQVLGSPKLESMDAMLASPAPSGVDAQPPLEGISSGSGISQEGSPLDMLDVLAADTPGLPFFLVIDASLSVQQ